MFRSKARNICIPQFEHARLSGLIANLWGNENFDRPKLDFDAFVLGATFHDRGYGFLDEAAIGETEEAGWLQYQELGRRFVFQNKTIDLLVRFHLRRLASYSPTPKKLEFISKIEEDLDREFAANPELKKIDFLWADLLIKLCDDISFDLCTEQPKTRETKVYSRQNAVETSPITYTIKPATASTPGRITLAPWPLSVESYSGFLIAYEGSQFPEKLEPVVVRYEITSE